MGGLADASRRHQSANDLFDERLGEFLGINRTDSRCLEIVLRLKKVSAGQLANESGLTTGAVTAIVDRLEAAGYAARVRDSLDRRKVWVEATPEVVELSEIIFGVYDVVGPVFARHFTTEQLQAIHSYLLISTFVSNELAEGLRENTQPGAKPDARMHQAREFRRAIEAMAPRLVEEIGKMASGGGGA